ncbi:MULTISPECIES: 2-dehydropantoate 2-reductase [Mesobacillus]|uniref:2-dehydropantoate 2-reductase n=1 Tax=Mesobacillus selenatarsenatis TaxID=388741 RepID=A0A846T8V0_9BACI|nr:MULTISPECIES: 2-dehydropantoate 2-reductase [Mesobacillus]NKE05378.1 2-dehydropantoate 2-reductase [Mesobacillus selenatarsenatis]
MKIGIIGGGSIGLLFSYYLSGQNEVSIYTRTQEQANEINEHGLHLIKGGIEQGTSRVKAAPIKEWGGNEELTIVAVKQYQLPKLLPELKEKMRGSILFLQNGYGHIKLLSELAINEVFVGSVEHGAVRANGYTVQHNGVGVTRTAVFRGNPGALRELSSKAASGFPFILETDFKEMLIKKLVVNAVINPLTAILKVKNGELVHNPYYLKIFEQLFEECACILELPDKEHYFNNLKAVCEKTANNHSSMYKDIENRRQTEVDAILGYLLELAKNKNKKAPLIHNYYHCIKGKEHEREGA